jgi:dTDP-glucose pyrophosphorylase
MEGINMLDRLKKVFINPGQSIKHVLKHMDSVGEKTVFVVNGDNRLLGSVTDGDIRRWILKGRSLAEDISRAMNQDPISLRNGFNQDKIKEVMLKNELGCLPIVDERNCVVSAVWWIDLFKNRLNQISSLKIPVVIMAGGEGVRLHPYTKILPKPLMPIGEKPIIEIIINKFYERGCKDFYISLNYKSNIIKAYFSDLEHKYRISYALETKPLGTIGSLRLLKNKLKKTFFVSNCDIIVDADYADMFKFHSQRKNKITLVTSMKNFAIPYGICEIENGGALKSIREKPEYDFLVNTGMYLLEPSVICDIPENKPYNITDLIDDYLKKKKRIGVYPISEKAWLDIGQIEQMQDTLRNIQ